MLSFRAVISQVQSVLKRHIYMTQLFQPIYLQTVTTKEANEENGHLKHPFSKTHNAAPFVTTAQTALYDSFLQLHLFMFNALFESPLTQWLQPLFI